MRLLHPGPDPHRQGPPGPQPEPLRGGDPRGARRRAVPLHGVREDRAGGAAGRGPPARRERGALRAGRGNIGDRRAPRRRPRTLLRPARGWQPAAAPGHLSAGDGAVAGRGDGPVQGRWGQAGGRAARLHRRPEAGGDAVRRAPHQPPCPRAHRSHRREPGPGSAWRARGPHPRGRTASEVRHRRAELSPAPTLRPGQPGQQGASHRRPGGSRRSGDTGTGPASTATHRRGVRGAPLRPRPRGGDAAGCAGHPRRAGHVRHPRPRAQRGPPHRGRRRGCRPPVGTGRPRLRGGVPDLEAAARPHRAARLHHLLGRGWAAGGPLQHTGTLPRPANARATHRSAGQADPGDQTAHRRRLRKQAGDDPGRPVRSPDHRHRPAGADGIHAATGVHQFAQPPPPDHALQGRRHQRYGGGRHRAGSDRRHGGLRHPRIDGADGGRPEGTDPLQHPLFQIRV